jgi:hypothetical protein
LAQRKRPQKDNATNIEAKAKENTQYINKLLNTFPIASWPWPRILLVVLKERSIPYADEVFDNFWQIAAQGVQPLFINYSRTDLARNKIAEKLLSSNSTHVIMLDIDHQHPIHIVQRLARWFLLDKFAPEGMKNDVQIVGGLNFRRSAPHDPCCHLMGTDGQVYAPADWSNVKQNELMQVDAIGTGSIMIAREVFEAMQPPWFFNTYDRAWADVWPGEDMGFSRKCREYGIKMHVDVSTTSPHITTRMIGEADFRREAAKNGHMVVSREGKKFLHEQ